MLIICCPDTPEYVAFLQSKPPTSEALETNLTSLMTLTIVAPRSRTKWSYRLLSPEIKSKTLRGKASWPGEFEALKTVRTVLVRSKMSCDILQPHPLLLHIAPYRSSENDEVNCI
jgi:hypothetical protein